MKIYQTFIKKNFYRIFVLIIFMSGFYSCQNINTKGVKDDQPYLVILSLDGFRWDYSDNANTPNLDRITKEGVKAVSMIPSFPTKTFPNHYTMVTGLYPDNHGIVINNFYDPETGKHYSVSDREAVGNGDFYGGEPVWVTAEKQGMKSASLFWVGSEAEINGVRPSMWKTYDQSMPFEQRIDTVISWLQLPEKIRPHLVLWYIHEPDSRGHEFGPESPEMRECVEHLDSIVGIFLTKLKKLPIADKVNFIVTSDHGMGAIYADKCVKLDNYIREDWVDVIHGGNPAFTILSNENYYDSIWNNLRKIPHLKVWKNPDLPERLHYGQNPRTLDFTVVADSGWSVVYGNETAGDGGTHGYDNNFTDMRTIFFAFGPAFKKGYKQTTFENVDLYPLMTEILELKPAENDGCLENVKPMLK